MNWEEAFLAYTAAYAAIAGTPMPPMRQSMARVLLRDRSPEKIVEAITAIQAVAGREGRTAAGLFIKFENGNWQP